MYRRAITTLIGLPFFFGTVSANDGPADTTDSASSASAKVTIIGPEEGEKYSFRDGRHVLLKVSKEAGANELFMGQETLPGNTAIPVHSHDGYEEIIFIHSGDAVVRLGEEEIPVEEGTTIFIPPGAWHAVGNHGDADTKMLFIFPETNMAEFFRALGKPKDGDHPELTSEQFQEIMKQHQMRSYPPTASE